MGLVHCIVVYKNSKWHNRKICNVQLCPHRPQPQAAEWEPKMIKEEHEAEDQKDPTNTDQSPEPEISERSRSGDLLSQQAEQGTEYCECKDAA